MTPIVTHGLFITSVNPAKTDEAMEMPSRVWTRGPKELCTKSGLGSNLRRRDIGIILERALTVVGDLNLIR